MRVGRADLAAGGEFACHDLLSFPPFIDESWHIGFAREVLSGHIIAGAAHGKLFVPIWMAVLFPTGDAALFIGRAATVLFSLISLALVYRIAADLVSRVAGLVAMLLYIFSAYLIFYERMALIDTYMLTFGLAAVAAASRLRRQINVRDASLCGLALAGALAAKGTGVALLVIPVLALILTPRTTDRRLLVRWLSFCYGMFAVIWLPLYGVLRWRRINYFGLAETLSDTRVTTNFGARLVANIGSLWQIDTAYFALPLLVIALGLGVYWLARDGRRAAYVILCAAIPTVAIMLLSPAARSRYVIYHVPLLLIAAAGGFEWLRRTFRPLSMGLAAVGLIGLLVVGLPFYGALTTRPADLSLPVIDGNEYRLADASGFALPEIAAFLKSQPEPHHAIGLLANCGGLQLILRTSDSVTLDCPAINWDGSRQSALAAEVNEQANKAPVYVILETSSYISTEGITASLRKVSSFERPTGIATLTLYIAERGSF